MRTILSSAIARIAVTAMFLVALLPGSSTAVAQSADTSYTDEDHGVTIGWTEQWEAELPTVDSPILSLMRDSSVFVLISILDGQAVSPEDAVWFMYQEGDEVVEDRSTETPPHLVVNLVDVGMVYTVEAYSLNDGDTTVLVSVGTVPVLQSSAVDIAQEDITINGLPVMTGQPHGEAVDLTGDATPESQSRTSRTSRDTTETTEATAEATAETERVSRTSRETAETPVAAEPPTEEPTTEATVEPTEDVVVSNEPGAYTGSVWGYTFTYDTDLWEESSTYDSSTYDGLRLDGESSTVAFMGISTYGDDPVACLTGEDEYFGADSESISNWEIATDANGDPLWYESDELAWGVFSYTFHSSTGTDVEFVDYISCETIPGEDAVLIVQMTSFPDDYNDNLDDVLDILDTLEFQP